MNDINVTSIFYGIDGQLIREYMNNNYKSWSVNINGLNYSWHYSNSLIIRDVSTGLYLKNTYDISL